MIYKVVRAVSAKEHPWYGKDYGGKGYPVSQSKIVSVNTGEELTQEKTVEGLLQSFVDGDRVGLQNWQDYDDTNLSTWEQQATDYASSNPGAAVGEDVPTLAAKYVAEMRELATLYSTPLPPPPTPTQAPAGHLQGLTWIGPNGVPQPITNVTDAAQLQQILAQILASIATLQKRVGILEG